MTTRDLYSDPYDVFMSLGLKHFYFVGLDGYCILICLVQTEHKKLSTHFLLFIINYWAPSTSNSCFWSCGLPLPFCMTNHKSLIASLAACIYNELNLCICDLLHFEGVVPIMIRWCSLIYQSYMWNFRPLMVIASPLNFRTWESLLPQNKKRWCNIFILEKLRECYILCQSYCQQTD